MGLSLCCALRNCSAERTSLIVHVPAPGGATFGGYVSAALGAVNILAHKIPE